MSAILAELGVFYSHAAFEAQKGAPSIFREAAFVAYLVGAKCAGLSPPVQDDDLRLIDALLRQSWKIFDTLGLESHRLRSAYVDLRNELDMYLAS